ncbi:MAG: O-antigen ligase family protein [Chitinophagaceae bacterium]
MIAALFFSRALLSVSMMLFVAVSFFHSDIKGHIRQFFSSPLLWGMSLLFMLTLLSGIWSEDKKEWLTILRIKLPLLALPLAFAGPFSFSKKQWEIIAFVFIGIVTAGTIWCMFNYVTDWRFINESYLRAKTLAVPLNNDHVRFSWLVSVTILLAGLLCWNKRKENKIIAIILIIIVCWLIIFLHILAARTGLFSFYIIALASGISLLLARAKPWQGIVVLILLIALPFAAYRVLPSFQNRVRYILYDYGYFKEMHYLPGGNDASRIISLRAGWNLLEQNPLTGTGAGDITTAIKKWDSEHYPGMRDTDKIYPSSEWLVYGLTAGWVGVLLFSIVVFIPCFIRRRNNLAWLLLNLTAMFGFLFDIGLEVQFGVFIYSFLILWWWKWLKPQKQITLTHD